MEISGGLAYHGPEAERLWTGFGGQWWSLPPDNRIDFCFQHHILEALHEEEVKELLTHLSRWYHSIGGRSNFKITDYDRNGQALEYEEHRRHYNMRHVKDILADLGHGSKW